MGIQKSAQTYRGIRRTGSHANVLIPQLGFGRDEIFHELDASRIAQDFDPDAL